MQRRKNRPLLVMDLGVPRNVEAEVNQLDNIYLYNIDDLQSVADKNMEQRRLEAEKAEKIVEKEASKFHESMVHYRPTLSALGKKFDGIRKQELEKTLSKLTHLSPADHEMMEKCTDAIVTKILHDPIMTLRSDEMRQGSWSADSLMRKLFRLDD